MDKKADGWVVCFSGRGIGSSLGSGPPFPVTRTIRDIHKILVKIATCFSFISLYRL